MLVHKETRGVLNTIATAYGSVLEEVCATVDTLHRLGLEINVDEWWFVPNSSPLARRIERCYPDFIPVTDETGELADIVDLKAERQRLLREQIAAEEAERDEQLRRDAEARGYAPVRKTRVAPMSMGFLQDTLRQRMGGADHNA